MACERFSNETTLLIVQSSELLLLVSEALRSFQQLKEFIYPYITMRQDNNLSYYLQQAKKQDLTWVLTYHLKTYNY